MSEKEQVELEEINARLVGLMDLIVNAKTVEEHDEYVKEFEEKHDRREALLAIDEWEYAKYA